MRAVSAVALVLWSCGAAAKAGVMSAGLLGIQSAQLGMTLQQWKSAPPPASAGPTAKPLCFSDERTIKSAGFSETVGNSMQPSVLCTYATQYGDQIVRGSVRIDGRYRGDDLRYLFVNGRLAQIRVRFSPDAYDDAVALLHKTYGAPSMTLRDTVKTTLGNLPRVRKSWRTATGSVTIIDPTGPANQLGLRYAAADSAP